MTIANETAQEYLRLADRAIERGETGEAIRYTEKALEFLLRPVPELEAPGIVRGESTNFTHLGKVLAEKARLRMT